MAKNELERPWWLLPSGRIPRKWWWVAGLLIIWFDYADGVYIQFPVAYIIPVLIAAWYSGRMTALVLSLVVPVAHVVFLLNYGGQIENLTALLVMTFFRAVFITLTGLWFARLSKHERALENYVERLEGLLPICSFCKKIRDDDGKWEPIETYISNRTEAQFSHGLCPSCGKKHYPDFDLTEPVTAK